MAIKVGGTEVINDSRNLVNVTSINGTAVTAITSQTDENFTTADHAKLDAIEASADVTDTANVVAALTAGTGITIANDGTIAAGPIALTTVQTAANQTAHLALTTQEGDIVVRSDENKSYVRNSGTAGDMTDFTVLATPTDAVTSVNGATGVVSLAMADISDTTFTSLASGEFLKYNGSAWVNDSVPTINTLGDIGNVTISSIASGEVIKWNGSAFINNTLAEANIVGTAGGTMTGDLTLNGSIVKSTANAVAGSSSSTAIDFTESNFHVLTLSSNTTLSFSNLANAVSSSGSIVIKQDGTGGRSFTLPSEAKTPVNGATIVQSTGANEVSVLSYLVVSSSEVLVNYIGDFA